LLAPVTQKLSESDKTLSSNTAGVEGP